TSTSTVTATTTTQIELITVPDLTGKTTSYAEGVLDTLGLGIYIEESPDLEGDSNVIQQQMPPAGTAVTQGSPVVVTVPAPQIRMPEGELSAAARGLLKEVGDLKAGEAATVQARRILREDPETEFNPFGLIIKFREDTTEEEAATALSDIGGSRVGQALGIENLYLVETLAELPEAVALLRSKDAIETVGFDYVVEATQFVNDEYLAQQWGLETPGLNLAEAWDISTGEAIVTVAVLDTGVDLDHPDLAANIWVNPRETPNNGIDDDNNGYIDDVNGWDFVNNDNRPDDDEGHGTHVAGTIGAVSNNGIGVAGISPNVRIMPLKALNEFGSGLTSDFFLALEYAVANGAEVSNNSWGGPNPDRWMQALIEDAGQVGHVFVAAAGNDESNNDIVPDYPNSYPSGNIISVAAIEESGGLASFSNYGRSSVHVAAPGRNILSTLPGGEYGWSDGTSMAAPHITGLVALMRSIQPNLIPSAIKNILIDTSAPDTRLRNLVASGGIVDAAGAVRAITQSLVPTTTVPPATTQPPTVTNPPTTTAGPTTTVGPTTTAGPTTTISTTTTTTETPRKPSSPQSLSVAWRAGYSGATIDLSWFSPADCGSEGCALLRYRIERQTNGGAWAAAAEVLGQQGTSHRFTNLDYARTYNFRVIAVNGAGVSPSSNSASVRAATTPDAPDWVSGCQVGGYGGDEFIISWDETPFDGGSPITGYKVMWQSPGTSTFSPPNLEAIVTASPIVADNTGSLRVYSINAYGTSSSYAATIGATDTGLYICPGTEWTSPSAPVGLTVTLGLLENNCSGRTNYCSVTNWWQIVNLSWQPPLSDGGAGIGSYQIEYSNDGGQVWKDVCGYLKELSCPYAGTTSFTGEVWVNEPAIIRVIATSGTSLLDDGPPSNTVTVTAQFPPGAPSQAYMGGANGSRIPIRPISWNAPAEDGGTPVVNYEVEYAISPEHALNSTNCYYWGSGAANWVPLATPYGPSTQTEMTINQWGYCHEFRVRATNSAGATGPWSDSFTGGWSDGTGATKVHPWRLPAAPTVTAVRADGFVTSLGDYLVLDYNLQEEELGRLPTVYWLETDRVDREVGDYRCNLDGTGHGWCSDTFEPFSSGRWSGSYTT
ncbi:MAG: S8 family serine peptidase, partial [Flavobacteriales bacterium]|nr:S8 family serine peptidase [Flavobacteriales bacterium]